MVAKPLCPLYKYIIKPLDRAYYPELRYSYEYQDDIAEATNHLKSVNLKDNGKYLLSFTVGKYDEKTLSKHLASLNEYMDAFPEESSLYWTYRVATSQKVTLFASISSEQ